MRLDYVLSLPISTLVSGIDTMEVLEQNLKIVRNFKPMDEQRMASIEKQGRDQALDGRFEAFKTTRDFDGPVHKEQHGIATG